MNRRLEETLPDDIESIFVNELKQCVKFNSNSDVLRTRIISKTNKWLMQFNTNPYTEFMSSVTEYELLAAQSRVLKNKDYTDMFLEYIINNGIPFKMNPCYMTGFMKYNYNLSLVKLSAKSKELLIDALTDSFRMCKSVVELMISVYNPDFIYECKDEWTTKVTEDLDEDYKRFDVRCITEVELLELLDKENDCSDKYDKFLDYIDEVFTSVGGDIISSIMDDDFSCIDYIVSIDAKISDTYTADNNLMSSILGEYGENTYYEFITLLHNKLIRSIAEFLLQSLLETETFDEVGKDLMINHLFQMYIDKEITYKGGR